MSLSACIREARGCVLENQAEDGVVRNLSAQGVPRRQDLGAGGFAGLSGDQDSVGKLSEDQSIGEDGGGAVDHDETEFVAPRGEQARHALGSDELGRAGRMSARVNDGKGGKAGDGMREGEDGVVGEHIAKAGIGGSADRGRGAEVGVDEQDRGTMLREDRGEAEGQGGRRVFGMARERGRILTG
jgi:hypothetical protein